MTKSVSRLVAYLNKNLRGDSNPQIGFIYQDGFCFEVFN